MVGRHAIERGIAQRLPQRGIAVEADDRRGHPGRAVTVNRQYFDAIRPTQPGPQQRRRNNRQTDRPAPRNL